MPRFCVQVILTWAQSYPGYCKLLQVTAGYSVCLLHKWGARGVPVFSGTMGPQSLHATFLSIPGALVELIRDVAPLRCWCKHLAWVWYILTYVIHTIISIVLDIFSVQEIPFLVESSQLHLRIPPKGGCLRLQVDLAIQFPAMCQFSHRAQS